MREIAEKGEEESKMGREKKRKKGREEDNEQNMEKSTTSVPSFETEGFVC